jgi:phosphatidylserine/phosphatidylglycerophosphate/cardiolipin synthase-like enzyme
MSNGKEPRFKPSDTLINRQLFLKTGGETNTVEVPGDPRKNEVDRWYETGGNPPMRDVTSGNTVKYMIDGPAAFSEILKAIRTATGPGHFIYLLGWFCDVFLPLSANDNHTNLFALCTDLDQQGVQIRAMLWEQFLSTSAKAVLTAFGNLNTLFWLPPLIGVNNQAVQFFNALQKGGAITDDLTPPNGAHHQKVLIVNGSQGLIAFCGGVDINPDRIHTKDTFGVVAPGAPLHDVHCQIQGEGANELLQVFVERWNSHPKARPIDQAKGGLLPPSTQGSSNPLGQFVQIAETYGSGGKPFPSPRDTVPRMITKAIKAAREFIYVEDQYFVNMNIARLLASVLGNIKYLTILVPAASLTSDLPEVAFRRSQCIREIERNDGKGDLKRLRVRQLAPPGSPNTYVHAKTWIFDDRYAIIGSPNMNRRGWTHDSEVAAGILDASTDDEIAHHFAHQLRIDLWAKHLNMDNPSGKAQLVHGVHSIGFWDNFPPGARIERYFTPPMSPIEQLLFTHQRADYDIFWDSLFDPA